MYWIIQLPPMPQESRGLKFGHNKGSFEICLTHFKNYCKHNKPWNRHKRRIASFTGPA